MKKSYLRWVPAYLPQSPQMTEDHFQLFNKEAVYHYPHALVSAGLWNGEDLSKDFRDCTLMIDSGGFQYGSKNGENLTPEYVMGIQERYADIGFVLDNPPFKFDRNYNNEWFERCLRITKSNGDKMQSIRTNDDFKLYGVIQGKSNEELRKWYDTITSDYTFDGYAISFNMRRTPEAYVRGARFLRDIGLRENVHWFGVLSANIIPIIAYANYVYGTGDRVTFDSATNSGRMADVRFNSKKYNRRLSRNLKEFNYPFCGCPICRAYEEFGVQNETTYVHIHNIYQYIQEFEWINTICNEREDIERLIPKKFIPWLDVIDGYEKLPEEKKNSLFEV